MAFIKVETHHTTTGRTVHMQASSQVLLRFLAACCLLIIAACVMAGSGKKCDGKLSQHTHEYSIRNWESMKISQKGSPYDKVEGQWYVVVVSVLFHILSLALTCVACRGNFRSRRGEGMILFFGFILILIAACLETYYVAGWENETGCYCISWAVACAFLWLVTLIFLWDAYSTHQDVHVVTFWSV